MIYLKLLGFGLTHPCRDLQWFVMGIHDGDQAGVLSRPSKNVETTIDEWVERIIYRRRQRHGI